MPLHRPAQPVPRALGPVPSVSRGSSLPCPLLPASLMSPVQWLEADLEAPGLMSLCQPAEAGGPE